MSHLKSFYFKILDSLNFGVFIFDIDMNIIYLNNEANNILNINEDIIKRNANEYIKVVNAKNNKIDNDFFDKLSILKSLKKNLILKLSDGKKIYISADITKIEDKKFNDLKEFYIMFFNDITKFKSTENILFQITKNIKDLICQTDEFGYITYLSPSYAEFLDREVYSYKGVHISELYKDKYKDVSRDKFFDFIKNNDDSTVIIKMNKKDEEFYFETKMNKILDFESKNVKGALFISRDITSRVIYEEELKREKEKAINANKAKSEFLANMSHEIRTPLNGIIGMTNLTLETNLNEEQKENLNLVRSSSKTLLKIINNILDLSKIEAGKMEVEEKEFKLRKIIRNTIKIFEPIASDKKIDLILDIDEDIEENLFGDYYKLNQILNNLISNAIKFTNSGFVKITLKKEVDILNINDKNKEYIHCFVEDSGIGIKELDLNKLFKFFSQVDSSYTKKHEGTGLGLYISKKLAQMLNGNIYVTSEYGKGTKFELKIPFKKSKILYKKDENGDYKKSHMKYNLKILLVEDDLISQFMMEKFLKKQKINYKIANNGKEAIDIVMKENFDIILMDIQMPLMDGIEATRIIRENNKKVKIIAVTAYATRKDADKFLNLGMDYYIPKPVNFQDLIRVFSKIENEKDNSVKSILENVMQRNNTENDDIDFEYLNLKLKDIKIYLSDFNFNMVEEIGLELKEYFKDKNKEFFKICFNIVMFSRKESLSKIEKLLNEFENNINEILSR
ncbi:MAG: response regulator [Peptostreptococcaceae bacterium]|jgi:PAS domain S-box-containing protein|nr:response regulator [Peptostreptococcaceae bacterium]